MANKTMSISSAPDEISAIVASASSLRRTRSPTRDETNLPSPQSSESSQNGAGRSVLNEEFRGPNATQMRQLRTDSAVSALNQSFNPSMEMAMGAPPSYMTQKLSPSRPGGSQATFTMQRRMTDGSLTARFGSSGNINFHDSPGSVRDEFTSWLFDDYTALPTNGYGGLGIMTSMDGFGNQIYPNFFDDTGLDSMFPMVSPQSTADPGTTFSTVSTSDLAFSEDKRQAILAFMEARFIEDDTADRDRLKEDLYQGDRHQDDHPLSLAAMHSYVKSYWVYFHDQVPLLHKPTFVPDDTHVQLLLAIMVIGASHINDGTSDGANMFARFTTRHLRWQVFRNADSRPPAKLWVFQTLLLLEVFEKTKSSRALHERSNVHSPTTITLMRRGTALIDDHEEDTSRRATSPEQWWRRWIQTEATRRAAFAAFLLDAYFSTMFGHTAVMSVHEVHLPLPCDDALWSATSAAEVGRVEASLHANGVRPPTFTEALKKIMTGRKVRTNTFGRTILMAGLLSVSWHMQQRDLQLNVLGMSRSSGNLPNNWKEPLSKSFDFWKRDFDESLAHMQLASLPWQHHRRRALEVDTKDSASVLWHLSHMFLHVDFRDCQILSGANNVAARPITDMDRNAARSRISSWINSPGGRTAVFHSLQCLRDALLRPSSNDSSHPYLARNDHLILRPWTLYIAGLIVFSWGLSVDGLLRPFPVHLLRSPRASIVLSKEWEASDQIKNAAFQDAQLYLQKIGAVASAQELDRIKAGRNNVVGLLRTLEFAFQDSRWELLQEAAARMRGGVQLLEQ